MPSYSDKEMDVLLAEWKEIRESLRYFGNKRFAQLTVFIAANGFMFNTLFAKESKLPGVWVGIAGGLFAIAFGIHEMSSVRYFKKFAERGEDIERELTLLRLMQKRPKGDLGTMVTYAIYAVIALAWFSIMFCDMIGVVPSSWHPEWLNEKWQCLTNQPTS